MTLSSRSRMSVLISLVAFATIIGGLLAALTLRGAVPHVHAKAAVSTHAHIDCVQTSLCLDPADPEQLGEDKYVGHDEPSNLFYSNTPGAGNRNLWLLRLPSDPTPGAGGVPLTGQTFNFELHPAFWFGMAICDTQSYPEQVRTCPADSDSNIVDPAVSANHPGTAFMEMQFYPPGWAQGIAGAGISCDAHQWCAALNIDSLSENGVTGAMQNATCQSIAGLEYVNFAFITRNGVAQAPSNPVQSTLATFTPDPAKDLFMNSGDLLAVSMHDTFFGLRIDILDLTTHQHGSMTSSALNGFGEVQYDPTGTSCNNIPTNFHPMYSTSSPATRVIWAAHSYNIAFSDEIGHFDYCTGPTSIPAGTYPFFAACPSNDFEGGPTDLETTDIDEGGCVGAAQSLLIQVSGCTGQNNGFDGVPYQNNAWPDGNPNQPTSLQFTSPLTGSNYDVNYTSSAFETDLPRIEAAAPGSSNNCIRFGPGAGNNCFLFPLTDDSTTPAATNTSTEELTFAPFYPYYSDTNANVRIFPFPRVSTCMWQLGGAIPGSNLFGQNTQYGSLLNLSYLPQGTTITHKINDFQGVQNVNPCAVNPVVAALANAIIHGEGGGGE